MNWSYYRWFSMIQSHFVINNNIWHQTITCVWCCTFPRSIYQLPSLFPFGGLLLLPTSSTTCYHYPSDKHTLCEKQMWCQIHLYYPPESVGSTTLIVTGSMLWSATIPCTPLLLTQTTITDPLALPPLPLSLSPRKMIKVCLSLRFSNSCLYTVLAWMTCEVHPVG